MKKYELNLYIFYVKFYLEFVKKKKNNRLIKKIMEKDKKLPKIKIKL